MNPENNRSTIKPPKRFDPFQDRVARDIRNRMSTAFIRSVNGSDPAGFESVVSELLPRTPAPPYGRYIEDRREQFRVAYRRITKGSILDPLHQAAVLWNQQLFFEAHELLEDRWHLEKGGRKTAIKGMIQAAGVYIHLSCGRHEAAKKLAMRAVALIEANRGHLEAITNMEEVIVRLKRVDPEPPGIVIGK